MDSVKSGDGKKKFWAVKPAELEFKVDIAFGISSIENVTHDNGFFVLVRLVFKIELFFDDDGSILV